LCSPQYPLSPRRLPSQHFQTSRPQNHCQSPQHLPQRPLVSPDSIANLSYPQSNLKLATTATMSLCCPHVRHVRHRVWHPKMLSKLSFDAPSPCLTLFVSPCNSPPEFEPSSLSRPSDHTRVVFLPMQAPQRSTKTRCRASAMPARLFNTDTMFETVIFRCPLLLPVTPSDD
jgi:hypothetical protein